MTETYGLLLDIDGPIASPETRTVRPEISRALYELHRQGSALVFNTGRSDAFVRETVLPGLLAQGPLGTAPIHAICEKGAVWFTVVGAEADEDPAEPVVKTDESMKVPAEFEDAVRAVAAEFEATMFFDATKRAMVSVEQNVDVRSELYLAQQEPFVEKVREVIAAQGLGERIAVDPTIISTDIEDSRSSKALGAVRALELLEADGVDPDALRWFTVGDSRTDYAMADEMHARGHRVEHVDVRPSDGIPEGKPYAVRTEEGLIHDDAGLAFLNRLAFPGSSAA